MEIRVLSCGGSWFILCTALIFVGTSNGHLQEEWKSYVDVQLRFLRSEILQYVKDHTLIIKTLSALNWHLRTLKMDIKQLEAGRSILKARIDYSISNVSHHIDSIEDKLKDLEGLIASHQLSTISPDTGSLESSETVQRPALSSTPKPTTTTLKPTTTTPKPTTTTPKPTTTKKPTTPKPVGPKLRLADGTDNKGGRVEVYYNGQWGTVCADNFEQFEATVICRMQGFSGGSIRVYRQSFGPGSGPIWLSNLRCRGNEQSLFACGSAGWGVHNCGHYEDAGVQCY
ncbi:soluble scavenger receptor cysteine-rich domain-containing protein SSC5D-like [Saccostrea cucullata]|uniref:soluble scavenger receptor cysteine-rich domain-containing protein SSC5D-like n=1 Tax=Saccostrea cuccullata TaxID=36930 RepID=UPI002ED47F15